MEEAYAQADAAPDVNTRLRDIEEKQRLLKDRLLLIGKSLVEEREKTLSELLELKRIFIILREETMRMKEFIQRVAEQLAFTARKEELAILQRQFDLFRKA